MKIRTIIVASAAALAAMTFAAGGGDFSKSSTSSKWKVFTYNPGEQHTSNRAAVLPGGQCGFQFVNRPDTVLMGTDHKSYDGSLLGDIHGATVTATFKVEGTATAFTFYGQNDFAGSSPAANCRLYFETKDSSFDYSNTPGYDGAIPPGGIDSATRYWWANPNNQTLVADGNTYTLTAHIGPGEWSNWDGHENTATESFSGHPYPYMDAFNNAASHVSFIGISFGGGYFFENGVGVANGQATFKLTSFTVSAGP